MTNITASKQGTIRLPQEVLNTLGWQIALDTNVLAGFFIDDVDDKEAQRQQQIARKVLLPSENHYVSLTVVLEFVWASHCQTFYTFNNKFIKNQVGTPR